MYPKSTEGTLSANRLPTGCRQIYKAKRVKKFAVYLIQGVYFDQFSEIARNPEFKYVHVATSSLVATFARFLKKAAVQRV